MILFDTYAWIEYFRGSKQGEIVKKYLAEEIITPTIVLAELSCKSAKENWNFEKCMEFIKSKSLIVGLSENIIVDCGKIFLKRRKSSRGFSLPDAIILTTAINWDTKILTGDEHFRDLKEAIMIK